jgi:hypothetical protein
MKKKNIRWIASLTTSLGIAGVPAGIVLPYLWADNPCACQIAQCIWCPAVTGAEFCDRFHDDTSCNSGSAILPYADYFTWTSVTSGWCAKPASQALCYETYLCYWDNANSICLESLFSDPHGAGTYTSVRNANCVQ